MHIFFPFWFLHERRFCHLEPIILFHENCKIVFCLTPGSSDLMFTIHVQNLTVERSIGNEEYSENCYWLCWIRPSLIENDCLDLLTCCQLETLIWSPWSYERHAVRLTSWGRQNKQHHFIPFPVYCVNSKCIICHSSSMYCHVSASSTKPLSYLVECMSFVHCYLTTQHYVTSRNRRELNMCNQVQNLLCLSGSFLSFFKSKEVETLQWKKSRGWCFLFLFPRLTRRQREKVNKGSS